MTLTKTFKTPMFQKKPKKPAAEKTQKHEKETKSLLVRNENSSEKAKQGRGNPPPEA